METCEIKIKTIRPRITIRHLLRSFLAYADFKESLDNQEEITLISFFSRDIRK